MKMKQKKKINIFFDYSNLLLFILSFSLPILFAYSFTVKKQNNNCDCDYRCNVKVLSDLEAKKINWTPKNTNIKTLKTLNQQYPINDKKFDKKIRFGYEYNVYQFNCRIKQLMKNKNGDYVLIMSDLKDTSVKIIGKIPNPECDYVSKSSFIKSFKSIRNDLDALDNDNIQTSNFTITGVYFNDDTYGVQIYPIMDIIKLYNKY